MPQYKFKVLAGTTSYNAGTDEKPKLVKIRMGETIETDLELDKMFNSPGSTKFERLEYQAVDTEESLAKLEADIARRKAALASAKQAPAFEEKGDELSKTDIKGLQEIARANGINLKNAKSREDMLKIIRESLVEA